MTFYYSRLLDRKSIVELADRYGFADPLYVEKFIMCFEAHHRIAQETDCVVRGGLCMPFYQPSFEVRRMSIDVDLMSPCTVREMKQTMNKIDNDEFKCSEYVPRDPYPLDNLVSYTIVYASCFGGDARIKVDAFCNADLSLALRQIRHGSKIMDFDVLQGMTILSRGSLLADKSTALALGTIGLKPTRKTEIAKQIYDIAVLLRLASQDDLAVAYDSYTKMTRFKIGSFRRDPPYTISDVGSSMVQSLYSFLKFDTTVTVTTAQNKRYNDFRGTYLSKIHKYPKTDHIADVLLVYLFDLSLQRYSATATSKHDLDFRKEHEVNFMHKVLGKLDSFRGSGQESGMGLEEEKMLKAEYIQDIPDLFVNKRILRGARLETVFLVRMLSSVSQSL